MFVFSSFQLDVANSSLRRGKQAIVLTPKAFNVLRYLVEHAGKLVTKNDLWRAVWPGVSVTDATLTVCVSELRKALGDDPRAPRYIETVHRLGYRFIADISAKPVRLSDSAVHGRPFVAIPAQQSPALGVVGRERELSQIHEWLERAREGERQLVFVTGEPGIGKTTVIEEFLRQEQLARDEPLWVGRGQCIEHYGTGEAYLPLLDALGRLCREAGGGQLVQLLDKHAPAWLSQMPALVGAAQRVELQGTTAGGTHARMVRELAEAIEVITAQRPLVLWLEDLHWSDYSTLEWLGFLARRREPARLLVLGTYRPVEVIVREHPLKNLKHELQIHGQCQELPLALLSENVVMEYLALRFASPFNSELSGGQGEGPAPEPLRKLAHTVYQRTDGNPLFMVNVVDYLVEHEVPKTPSDASAAQPAKALGADRVDTPPSIVQMIERNLERLNPDEQAVLEAASVAGAEFPVATVAAALGRPISEVEACCTRLSRQQQFVQSHGTGEWPDGTVAARFQFLHGLYRDVLYDRIPPGRRVELHCRIADRGEQAYGEDVGDVAVELAYHYRRCGNKTKAIEYLDLAGERAAARRAYHEAEQHYRDAIAVLRSLPESSERFRRELSLLLPLGNIMGVTRGFSTAETAEVYGRARLLTERAGISDPIPIFYGLSVAAMTQGELQAAMAINHEMLEIARGTASSPALFLAHTAYGSVCHFVGLIGAREHLVQASEHYRDGDFRGFPHNPALTRLVMSGNTEWHLGYPDRALHYMDEALALARPLNDPIGLGLAQFGASLAHQLRADWLRMLQSSEETLRTFVASRYTVLTAAAKIHVAYSRAQMGQTNGAAERIREALSELTASKFYLTHGMHMAWLVEVHALAGDIAEAMVSVERALGFGAGASLFQPELLRLRGEVRLRSGLGGKALFEMAEQDFRAAIETARTMRAKSDELRATTSLARLLRSTHRRDEARTILTEIYTWFTEGFDTGDLRQAKLLLDELR